MAIALPHLRRPDTDAWLIPQTGLPNRAIHSLTRGKIQTVGQLRAQKDERLLQLRGFGARSLRAVHQLLDLCTRLDTDGIRYRNLEEFLHHFLSPMHREVVEHRYGLRQDWSDARGPHATLQALASRKHLTRERIRQLQAQAAQRLMSLPAQLVLHELARMLEAKLQAHGGAVATESSREWRDPLWTPYSTAGALWLLRQFTARFRFRYGVFTTEAEAQLTATEKAVLNALTTADAPLPADAVLSRLPVKQRSLGRALLAHHPLVAVTTGGEHFLPPVLGPRLVEQLLRAGAGPMHFRRLAERYNALLAPRCRVPPRRTLNFLRANPRCEALGAGFYRLRRG